MTETQTAAAAATPLSLADKVAKSSQVCFVDYDPAKQEMAVIFRGSPGRKYIYKAYPPDAWLALKNAESIGSFLYRNVTRPINGNLPYEFEMVVLPAGTPLPEQPAEAAVA